MTSVISFSDLQVDIDETVDSTLPVLHTNKTHKFTASIHARNQAEDRHPEYTSNQWKDFHSKVEAHLNTLNRNEKKGGPHLFYSKSHDVGYVASVDHKKRSVHVITVLPKGKSQEKLGTTKYLVEIFVD